MVTSTIKHAEKVASSDKVEAAKTDELEPEVIQKQVEEAPARSLEEVLGYAEKAYATYLEAERELTTTYKENEVKAVDSCLKAEKRAQAECDRFITKALKEREEAVERALKSHNMALQQAEEALNNAKQKADEICREKVDQSQHARSTATNEALKIKDGTIAQAWSIYARVKK